MQLSVFYDHILNASKQTGKPLPSILEAVSAAGIQAVELDLHHFSEATDHLSLLKEAGLKLGCVNAFYEMEHGFDEGRAMEHIRCAVRCGADRILVVPGFLSEEEGRRMAEVIHDTEAIQTFLEETPSAVSIASGLHKIVQMAAVQGVTVTVEDFDNVTSPLSGLHSLLWYLDRVPGLSCTFDTGNFITHEDDLFEAWTLLRDRVDHVHCKDRGEGPVAIGDGHLPCGRILERIAADGYRGYVAIEHYGASDQLDTILRSAAYLTALPF